MEIHESSEDYLEKILMLQKRLGYVHSIDIVNELGFSKPSVSIAMKKLRENGYIEIYNYPRGDQAVITYTSDGHSETIKNGETKDALFYEIEDMEDYVSNKYSKTLEITSDVMKILTKIRKQWGMIYPFE